MSSKKILSIILASAFVASCFAGCSSSSVITQKPTQSSTEVEGATQQQEEIMDAPEPEEEIVSFTDVDENGNKLVMSPIFDNDGVTVVAGYVLSAANDKSDKLTAKECKYLSTVVSASFKNDDEQTTTKKNEIVKVAKKNDAISAKKIILDKNTDGSLVPITAYSDTNGTIVAMQDTKDLNGNMLFDDILRVDTRKDANGLTKLVASYTVVTISKNKNGFIMTDGDKKMQVVEVNSSNTAVAEAEQKKVEKNKSAKKKAKEKKKEKSSNAAEEAGNPSSPEGESPSPEASQNEQAPAQSATDPTQAPTQSQGDNTKYTEKYQIVLKPNGKAATNCDSSKVEISSGEVKIVDSIPAAEKEEYVITSEAGSNGWHGKIVIELTNDKECGVKFKDVYLNNVKGSLVQIIDKSIKTDRTFLEEESGAVGDGKDDKLLEGIADNDSAPDVTISFPEGTSSTFKSLNQGYTGVIYNESKLTIKGKGKVNIESTKKMDNCICSTKSITIKNVSVNMTTDHNTEKDTQKIAEVTGAGKGIFSYSKVTVESGSLNIKTNGDGIRCNKFIIQDGTADVFSAACDGIDVDNEISVLGGTLNSTATQKSSLKVRRVNNHEKNDKAQNGVFLIKSGKVVAQGKKASTVQTANQEVIICKIFNDNTGIEDPALQHTYGKPGTITIKKGSDKVISSSHQITTFLYSQGALDSTKKYTMNLNKDTTNVIWKGKIGTASLIEKL